MPPATKMSTGTRQFAGSRNLVPSLLSFKGRPTQNRSPSLVLSPRNFRTRNLEGQLTWEIRAALEHGYPVIRNINNIAVAVLELARTNHCDVS